MTGRRRIGFQEVGLPLVAALFAVPGCSGPADLEPVSGVVTYRGAPLKRGHIVLEPAAYRSARGLIVDGKIVNIHTHTRGDGAHIGRHRVAVTSFVREPQGMEIVPSAIPVRYNNPATSGIAVTIERGKTNELKIDLHPE